MEHKWNKLVSFDSDHACMPIYTTTFEQCSLCRAVRQTYESPGYWSIEACHIVRYTIGDGMISTEPPCLDKLTSELELRNEVKSLRDQMKALERKVLLA